MALKEEFEYYLSHQEELVQKYNGRVIVIKDSAVVGDYSSEIEAIEATKSVHALGTFLVQRCSPGPAGYTMTYHSRVSFPVARA